MAKKNPKIARRARLAFEKWREYFQYNIDLYHEMHSFVLGRQWTDDEQDMLKSFKKVPLQFNKLGTLVNTLLGEQQQNTPQIEVVPLSDADEQVTQIRTALLKNIMLSTDAKTVYQVAAGQAFIGGFGAYMIDTEYPHDKSFDLEPVYHYFKDSSRCYWDVGAEEINKTDGLHAGFSQRLTRQKFRQIFGEDIEKEILTESNVMQSKQEIALVVEPTAPDDEFSWANDESITILHHYERKYVKNTIYKLSNGDTVDQKELEEIIRNSKRYAPMTMVSGADEYGNEVYQSPNDNDDEENGANDADVMTLYVRGQPVRIEDKKQSQRSRIMHYLIAGDYVLEESEFPAEDLPIIFVDQNSYYEKTGKQVCRPFIIDAIDAQRYLNYLGTQAAFVLKISRYDQFIASKQNVRSLDTQRTWRDPNAVQGALIYDESDSGAKPEQLKAPELSMSLGTQYERAIEDMYTSTGLYPSRMGQQGNEVSGAAIDARTRQGSYSTYVAFNSINRAIAAGGRILNQMIPRVYDSERVISIMMPDEGYKTITVNKMVDEYGEIIENDIRKGTYEVVLQAGPSYEGQKQQALDSLNMVLQANPQLLNLFADLYAENLPLTNTIEIKNRLKTIVPPEIIEAGKTGKSPQQQGQNQPSPEQQQQLMQQQQMQMDAMFKQKQLELQEGELQLKMKQQQLDYQLEMQKIQEQRLEMASKIKEGELRYMAETQRTEQDAAIAHADNLVKILTHNANRGSYDNRNK